MQNIREAHPENPHAATELMLAAYKRMGDALKQTGRPIVYSLCQYGMAEPWKWGPSYGANMWRTTDDIEDSYFRMIDIGFSQAGLSKYAAPGHWNDPDMLEIGNGKMSEDEYKTHMSLWVILAAPLLAGNDLSKMSDADKAILTNPDAIGIDQDSLGKEGDRLYQTGDYAVWTKPLSGGRLAVAMFNSALSLREMSFDLSTIGFPNGATLKDVWKKRDLGRHVGVFTDTIPRHGVTLLIVEP
jgi:alpha-galactosidase